MEYDENQSSQENEGPVPLDDVRPEFRETFPQRRDVEPSNPYQSRIVEQKLNSMLPKGAELKRTLFQLDVGMRFSMLLHQIISTLFWSSVLEIAIWITGLFCFFSYPKQMGIIWMHMFHIPRGILGLYLLRKMPKTHDMLEEFHFPEEEPLKLADISYHLTDNFKKAFLRIIFEAKTLLFAYFALTCLNGLLDFIGFFIQIARFGKQGDEYSDIVMLIATFVLLGLDVYYFLWTQSLRFTFPASVSGEASKGLLGFVSNLKSKVTEEFRKIRTKSMSSNSNTHKQPQNLGV